MWGGGATTTPLEATTTPAHNLSPCPFCRFEILYAYILTGSIYQTICTIYKPRDTFQHPFFFINNLSHQLYLLGKKKWGDNDGVAKARIFEAPGLRVGKA